MNQQPTTLELATITATLLARGSKAAPEKLTKQALAIWQAAEAEQRRLAEAEAAQHRNKPLPTPKKFPLTLDEFLRLVLPKKVGRTGDRAAIFKAWLRENETATRWKLAGDESAPPEGFAPTDDEVATLFGEQNKTPITNLREYAFLALAFRQWHDAWQQRTKHAIYSANAAARWNKPKPKKLARKSKKVL